MQTYIVFALLGLAAGYVIYTLLRRFGVLGAPAGCGCCCEGGCVSSGRAVAPEREACASAKSLAALELETARSARQGCGGCSSSGGCCQDKTRSENNGQV